MHGKTKLQQERYQAANIDYWVKEGYLDGIDDDQVRMVTALALENQKLYDSQADPSLVVPDSLKIVREVIPNLLAFKLVSVQPMMAPNYLVEYLRFKYVNKSLKPEDVKSLADLLNASEREKPEINLVIEDEPVTAKVRKVQRLFQDENPTWQDIAKAIIKGFDLEILTDLYNNVGTIATADESMIEQPYWLKTRLFETAHVIHRKTLRGGANWIVMSPETHEKYKDHLPPHRFKIHVIDGWTRPGFLLGYAGDSYLDRHYMFCPYVLVAKTTSLASEGFIPRQGYLTRYGKKLMTEGSKMYAKMVWKESNGQ